MPNPLIIFENHFSPASREFIVQNAASLKKMGYTKFLLEMNSEISPALVKLQLSMTLKNPEASLYHASSKALLDMLIALEKNDIPYEFIDPETQEEARKINQELISAAQFNDAQLAQIKSKRQQLTNHRDEIMYTTILEQAKAHQGGVLFLGGFAHTHLVKKLELNQPNFCRYALFVNSSKDECLGKTTVVNMPNEQFRAQFYQAFVSYFDMAKKPSFEIIAAECKLLESKTCEQPMVGFYLSQATQQHYHFTINNDYVVTATAVIEQNTADKTISRIRHEFPGLRFFTEQRDAKTLLNIPGINLPENATCLKEGFVKTGVMKSC